MKSTFKKMDSDESSRRRKLATSGTKLTEEEVKRIKKSMRNCRRRRGKPPFTSGP